MHKSLVNSFVAVENPHKNLSNFWLAKVVRSSFQHKDGTVYSQEDHIELKKGSYYITIHVYKPKMAQGQVIFQWDPNREVPGTLVRGLLMQSTDIAVESHQIGRARRTRHTKQTDAYDLKYLSEREVCCQSN
mmetsp:Transcript_40334/g.79251  ORF Transcript_40334/g.79251 Transcript_40334/m.79251 type:complete len:132 (+) Transcript_40334:544-939(+)